MELTKEICKVIADLEYCIGSECYNPNSYDGWNDIEGCDFRYPINIRNKDGQFVKIRMNINKSYMIDEDDITPESMMYMKYKFGSNELFVGKGIIRILEYLEKRYNLDFEALESEQRADQ